MLETRHPEALGLRRLMLKVTDGLVVSFQQYLVTLPKLGLELGRCGAQPILPP